LQRDHAKDKGMLHLSLMSHSKPTIFQNSEEKYMLN
jgi:hypothetical protein